MHTTDDQPPRRRRHTVPPLLAVAAAALLTSACGSAQGGQPVAGGPTGGVTANAVAYAQCMRSNGVPGFPDPNASGDFAIDAGKLGVDIESPQYQQAEQTCAPLMPVRSAEQQQEDYQHRLRYAQCMREQGITDFPDPLPPADGPNVESNTAGEGQSRPNIDVSSPQFQAAHNACKDLLPEGDEGPSLDQSS